MSEQKEILLHQFKAIDVHFLKSRKTVEYALCFTEHNKKQVINVVWYTTRDGRGPISSLIPRINTNEQYFDTQHNFNTQPSLLWGDIGEVRSTSDLDTNIWSDCTFITTITVRSYDKYKTWVSEWSRKSRNYGIFQGTKTQRSFIRDSLSFLGSCGKISYLFAPEIRTYKIEYDRKQLVSIADMKTIIAWYKDMSDKCDNIIESSHTSNKFTDMINLINSQKVMAFRQMIDGEDVYWILSGHQIIAMDSKLEIETMNSRDIDEIIERSIPDPVFSPCNCKDETQTQNITPVAANNVEAVYVPNQYEVLRTKEDPPGYGGVILIVAFIVIIILMIILVIYISYSYGEETNKVALTAPKNVQSFIPTYTKL